jgi:hypothetical protein
MRIISAGTRSQGSVEVTVPLCRSHHRLLKNPESARSSDSSLDRNIVAALTRTHKLL